MAEVEIKRGYEVLPDNNIRFGIKVTNTDGLVITDVEVTLYYPESLFSLDADRHQNLGNISPASTRTAEFLLKPLGCVHEENIEAHISYRDPKGHRHSVDMQPKKVHCVCPFLKGLKVPKAKFLELSSTGHSAETGLNFEGVSVERLTSFLVQTCHSRHYKVDELSIDGGRMLYLASESIGEKAYYLLTVLIKEDGGLTQVMLRAVSDKPHGLNGFLSETVADLRHVVETVQSAREIGVIRKEQVINIIDSVLTRPTIEMGEGIPSFNIEGSVLTRPVIKTGEDGRVEKEQTRKDEQERLRIQRGKEEKQSREEAEEAMIEKERKTRKEQEVKKQQEELHKKQEDEKAILRRQKAQRAEQVIKAQAERERIEHEHDAREEGERAAQEITRREQDKQKAREEAKQKDKEERLRRKKAQKGLGYWTKLKHTAKMRRLGFSVLIIAAIIMIIYGLDLDSYFLIYFRPGTVLLSILFGVYLAILKPRLRVLIIPATYMISYRLAWHSYLQIYFELGLFLLTIFFGVYFGLKLSRRRSRW